MLLFQAIGVRDIEDLEEGISLREICRVCLNKIHILFMVMIVCLIIGIIGYYTMKPSYKAKGSILIVCKDESLVVTQNQISVINSLVGKDFVLKPVIAGIKSDLVVEEFKNVYNISSSIENNFINIFCESKNEENSKKIINLIIDNLSVYLTQYSNELFKAELLLTEYATYTIINKTNIAIFLLSIFIVSLLVFGLIVIIIVNRSPYIQTHNQLTTILDQEKILSLKDNSLFKVIECMIGSKFVFINGLKSNDKMLKTIRNVFTNNNIAISICDYREITAVREIKEDSTLILICGDNNFNYATYIDIKDSVDTFVNFISFNKTKKSDMININYLFKEKCNLLNVLIK